MRADSRLAVPIVLIAAVMVGRGSEAAVAEAPIVGAISSVPTPVRSVPLPMRVVGRGVLGGTRRAPVFRRQWPGTYFETAFRGRAAMFVVGPGDVDLRVVVDDRPLGDLVRPTPGFYRVGRLAPGRHRLRVEIVSESQSGATDFGGFFAAGVTRPEVLPARSRQIEFVGDSHTVGYGNTSPTQTCDDAQVWRTTDTALGIAGIAGRRYGADYRVDAISGRGVVRNYAGGPGATIPEAYPFTLFDQAQRDRSPEWQPQAIVVALGTNDFSTPLHAGEKWSTRTTLHADYEATYLRFLQTLRERNPAARIVLWATDLAEGEIADEEERVVRQMRDAGDSRVDFVRVPGLSFSACHHHPSVADDRRIVDAVGDVLDADAGLWQRPRP
ncbi:MAG: GDSL-type esterase/lipase family protein [Janthinobacterium lividum]